jgi:hypothetical protein
VLVNIINQILSVELELLKLCKPDNLIQYWPMLTFVAFDLFIGINTHMYLAMCACDLPAEKQEIEVAGMKDVEASVGENVHDQKGKSSVDVSTGFDAG